MAENGDDVITSWRDRVGSLRKRGRTSAAALTVVPGGAKDAHGRRLAGRLTTKRKAPARGYAEARQ